SHPGASHPGAACSSAQEPEETYTLRVGSWGEVVWGRGAGTCGDACSEGGASPGRHPALHRPRPGQLRRIVFSLAALTPGSLNTRPVSRIEVGSTTRAITRSRNTTSPRASKPRPEYPTASTP